MLFSALCTTSFDARADDPRDLAAESSRERIEQWRREQNQRAAVLSAPTRIEKNVPISGESPCFHISRFELTINDWDVGGYEWLLRDLGAFKNACFGPVNIELLRANLQARLIEQGLVTSSVEARPQSLAGGTLSFELKLGRVETVVFAAPEGAPINTPSHRAVALKAGSVLNLRDIEQALENLSRLPSQAPQFRIEPGTQPDSSRIVIATAGGRRWRGNLTFETTETSDYGPLVTNAGFSFDAPLNMSDQLSVSLSGSMHHHGTERPTQTSMLVNYSVPLGAHLASVNLSRSDHKRSIQGGVSQFTESGSDTQLQARWQWTAWRSQEARLSVWTGVTAKRSRAYIEDTELLLRRRNSSSFEAGGALYWKHPCGDATVDAEMSRTQRLSRDLAFESELTALPESWRTQVQWGCRLSGHSRANLSANPSPGQATEEGDGPVAQPQPQPQPQPAPWRWEGRAWAQGSRHPAGSADLTAIGSKWTVRGHEPRQSLSGQGAVVLRQELVAPAVALGTTAGFRAFVGIDYGRIHQTREGNTNRRELAGLALGLRWQWAASAGELTAARPILKSDESATTVAYGNLSFSF